MRGSLGESLLPHLFLNSSTHLINIWYQRAELERKLNKNRIKILFWKIGGGSKTHKWCRLEGSQSYNNENELKILEEKEK